MNIYNELIHILEDIKWVEEKKKNITSINNANVKREKNELLTLIEKTDKKSKNRVNTL